MVRKNSQQTKRMGRNKKQCTQTMQTRRMGRFVRNKYLGDHHQNNKIEIHVDNETALIYYPYSNTTTGLNLRTQMQALKDMQVATHAKHPEYLLYGQNHFNAVWHNTKIKTKGNNKIKRKNENKQIKKLKNGST